MIPFYMERLRFIQEELAHKANLAGDQRIPQEELNFLLKTKQEVERSLEKEKLEVNKMANSLYTLWKGIVEERDRKKFLSTNVELKVHQTNDDITGETDQLLDLKYDNGITPDKELPSNERSRQNRIKKLEVYAVLLINDRKVAKSNKAPCNWPNFNFQIKEIFQVHLFTQPSSIKVELVLVDGISDTVIDLINIEVPGQHVRSLTCSAPLVQKLPFSKVNFEKSKVAKKYLA